MVKCKYCGYEAQVDKFKLLRDPWKFRFYTVRRLECPNCHGIFNYYHGTSPKSNKVLEFTIGVKAGKQ